MSDAPFEGKQSRWEDVENDKWVDLGVNSMGR